MGTYILNKYQAAKFKLNPHEYNVIIRISSPLEPFIPLENEGIYRDILELKFYDLTDKQDNLTIFNDEHLNIILNFFKKHEYCNNMIIQCEQGQSRSAAVSIGWFLYKDDRSSIYKIYHNKKYIPNRFIVEKFSKRLNKSMKYIDKWEKERFQKILKKGEDL